MTASDANPTEEELAIGIRLRMARNRAGYSLEKAARASGGRLKQFTLGSYERADRRIPARRLLEIARLYKCSPSWLLTGADEIAQDAPVLLEHVFAYLAAQSPEELGELAQRAMQTAEYGRVLLGVPA